ncbi:hypothetical protein CH254_15545 [Rhodococcus sp. 06-412-2C]|uniref:hypothetical protein n=1 Tax=unclassified Rhodococcus (in: high G+C Gram-positive bacteria) TaxID=192944 RepID=UPI000B9A852B|nr:MULTISPECIES: hypothetical protein [unclassified Rhodococcus (in: high G+C Gram-positive bacteria)]OZC87107.1 hypothetical protein CH254_15545 [Rhodococcus sp. 06-412-2C]OZC99992.1 hypothetical protein CH279_05910 [Rhodococcus sp. 06-412-2B]
MVPFRPVRPTHTWVGRTGAFLAVASAAVHVAGLADHGSAHALIILAMAIGCLYCARHLWAGAITADWALVAIMNVGMFAAHQNMSMPGSHSGQHHSPPTANAITAMPYSNAALAIAATEVAFATAVVFTTTRSVSVRDLRRIPPSRTMTPRMYVPLRGPHIRC